MSDSPFFQFYPSDWLAGTRGLTAAETGIYITLIAMMYEREAPISMPIDRLARLCGSTVTNLKKAISTLIDEEKIIETDAGFWNTRVECECEKRSAKRESAKTSANKRWKKSEQNQRREDANAMRTQCVSDANQKPEPDILKDTNVSLSFPMETTRSNDAAKAVASFNAAAAESGWSQVQKLTASRSKQIRARLADCGGIEGWEVALRKAQDSDFLCGRTAKPWTGFGFDWLTKQSNFTKLMEGNYDNRNSGPDKPTDPVLRAIARAAGSF